MIEIFTFRSWWWNLLRIAVCDDEKLIVDEISQIIDNFTDDNEESIKVYKFNDGYELIKSNIKFNLIFLDIEMPEINGIELAENIRKIDSKVQIVYVTNYQNYMKKAYNVHAFDYIQKPVEREQIHRVLEDYLKIINPKETNVIELTSLDSENLLIDVDMIIDISCGHKKRTVIVITTESEYICKGKISDIYDSLNSFDFFMPHRSHIINLSMVKSFKKKEKVIMVNGDEIPLSKGNNDDFLTALARKMHEKINGRILWTTKYYFS